MDWASFGSALGGAVVGGLLSLAGTWLANFLQHQRELSEWKRERVASRLDIIRQYLLDALDSTDLLVFSYKLSQAPGTAITGWDKEYLQELVQGYVKRVSEVPGRGSGRVLYSADAEILEDLERFDDILEAIDKERHGIILGESSPEVGERLREKRKEMQRIAIRISERIDHLLDETK